VNNCLSPQILRTIGIGIDLFKSYFLPDLHSLSASLLLTMNEPEEPCLLSIHMKPSVYALSLPNRNLMQKLIYTCRTYTRSDGHQIVISHKLDCSITPKPLALGISLGWAHLRFPLIRVTFEDTPFPFNGTKKDVRLPLPTLLPSLLLHSYPCDHA